MKKNRLSLQNQSQLLASNLNSCSETSISLEDLKQIPCLAACPFRSIQYTQTTAAGASDNCLYSLIHESKVEFAILDADFQFVYCNREALKNYGFKELKNHAYRLSQVHPELTPRRLHEILHPLDKQNRVYLQSTRKKGRRKVPVELCIWRDGKKERKAFLLQVRALESNHRLNFELAARLRRLQDYERQRISHEIHDQLGQSLTSLKLALHSMKHHSEPMSDEECIRRLRKLNERVDETIRSTRQIARALRSDQVISGSLRKSIPTMAEEFLSQAGIAFSMEWKIKGSGVSKELATTLHRIAQEAITNVARHSKATAVKVRIFQTEQNICLEIEDNGAGFNPNRKNDKSSSIGMSIMKERAEIWGGQLEIYSRRTRKKPLAGTRILAVIPLEGKI